MRRLNILSKAAKKKVKVEQVFLDRKGSEKQKQEIKISGFVTSAKNGQPMAGASIQIDTDARGVSTALNGAFTMKLTPGRHILHFGSLNYEEKIIDLTAYEDGVLNVELDEKPLLLDEIVIQYQAAREVVDTRIGQLQISLKEMRRLPALMGEADVIKQVQTLPGVTTVGEAAAGFNVRGGSIDQNLVLYDGLPIYNTAHALGFLSAFNAEAIKSVDFFKGGIPAEYGGRISSVLDMKASAGDLDRWSARGGIGMISAHAAVDGPIKKGKTTFASSLRSTYSDWLVRSIRTDYADLRRSDVSFIDATFKVQHAYNNQSRLSISAYHSNDGFTLIEDTTFRWKNNLLAINLDHEVSTQLQARVTAGVTSYQYNILNNNPLNASDLRFRVTNYIANINLEQKSGANKLHFGWNNSYSNFNPGEFLPRSEQSSIDPVRLPQQNTLESSLYISNQWTWGTGLFLEGGLRAPLFFNVGRSTVFEYNGTRTLANITDTVRHNFVSKFYTGLEPRLSFKWNFRSKSSLKVGYDRAYQFVHLISNTAAVTPLDIWQPSSFHFKPQIADQLSIGFFRDFKDKKYALSVESFYKRMQNILEFRDAAQLVLNRHLETDLLQGKGYAHGFEAMLTKNTGTFTWNLNYTYSRSFRLVKSNDPSESINDGERYPANFDQPHVINLSWKLAFTRRIFFTGNFTYHTGRPITIPQSAFIFENTAVTYFSKRNQYRIPDYHRLDMALVIENGYKRKSWKSSWTISVYNVYARKNPYSIFFRNDDDGLPVPYQLSIIGTVFPSISYNFNIG